MRGEATIGRDGCVARTGPQVDVECRVQNSELRNVCVMVLDIRDFTTFSETRAPDEVVRYLNTLWTFMVRTINEHNGIVNKFLGDGFLAVFGAPLSNGSVDCVNAMAA